MSISEQIRELREIAKNFKEWEYNRFYDEISEAADTIESLSAKLQAANEELERWHADRINENIKNPFAQTSTLICHNCDHKDEYIEELEAANMERSAEDCGGWISCKERLPDDFETVIAYTDENQIVSVARDGQDWVLYDGNIISEKVIAWRPLPEPCHEP